jgi:two-component system, OmpR family, alkaline phosphatase synthesis response regulator PhoP
MGKEKILIVDDEPHVTRSLSFVLSRENYAVEMAENGEVGLTKALQFRPDIILLDVMMPGKNGYEVCHEIRQSPVLKDSYIIILSAKGWDIDRAKALTVGANEFMSKPFSPREVVSKIGQICQQLELQKIEAKS